ncbi:MAG: DUF1326 domain-containing protein [Acidimicrobiales bacterium]
MAWTMKVRLVESCSCAQLCPCILGPAKPDQEWCSGAFGMEVAEGDAEGVDLSGAKVVLHFELPGDFLGGIDKAKLYIDPSVSDAQRSQIDSIFHGEKGGLWGGMRENIKEWLPSTVAKIDFGGADAPGFTVEGVGQIVLKPILAEEGGAPTTIVDAPIIRAFGMKSENLAFAQGTSFSDADLRSWESLGAGGIVPDLVEWAG